MTQLRPVRGTHDWAPEETRHYRHIVDAAREVAALYGFSEVMTPIFEYSDVFHRTLGDTSDIVSKETYTFDDRGGDSITLRPEITAAIVRAFISNGWQNHNRWRYFYAGPAFRYERPQKGRMRQFHQLGVECLGEDKVASDFEIITMAYLILQRLELEQHVTLEINTLGTLEDRDIYRKALVEYLEKHKSELSQDSLNRLEKNPLRILDSKDDGDKELLKEAPILLECLSAQSKEQFDELLQWLDQAKIAYQLNSKLVRGLDYYQHTVFEFTTEKLGAQNTVLAGGRYNGLVKQMGGKEDFPGIGFASGIERLVALRSEVGVWQDLGQNFVIILPLGDAAEKEAGLIMNNFRRIGQYTDCITGGNIGKRIKKAERLGASHIVILGDDELTSRQAKSRDLKSGAEELVDLNKLTILN